MATYKPKRKTATSGTTEEVKFPISSIDGLQTALDGKSGTGHKHTKSDITDFPTIPTVNNATLTIQKNGTNVATFTANASSNATANITVPTKTSELTNNSDFATNSSVDTKISNLVNSAPEALNTLGELATALEAHEDAYDALLQTVGSKFDKTGGTIKGNVTITNGSSAQKNEPSLKWKTVGANTPYIGFATDQSDGTFLFGSLTGTNYQSGLAIGGGSGNLLWKGARVTTANDLGTFVPSCTTSNNGQFLMVVNGKPAWTTVPNAEGVEF